MYYMYICAYIPIHAHTYMSMYKYTHTHLHILLNKEGSDYRKDHWLQNLLRGSRLKHCTHLSDPEISINRVPTALEKSLRFRSVSRSWKNHWISLKVLEICKNEKIMEKSLNFGSITHGKIIEFWNIHSFVLYGGNMRTCFRALAAG